MATVLKINCEPIALRTFHRNLSARENVYSDVLFEMTQRICTNTPFTDFHELTAFENKIMKRVYWVLSEVLIIAHLYSRIPNLTDPKLMFFLMVVTSQNKNLVNCTGLLLDHLYMNRFAEFRPTERFQTCPTFLHYWDAQSAAKRKSLIDGYINVYSIFFQKLFMPQNDEVYVYLHTCSSNDVFIGNIFSWKLRAQPHCFFKGIHKNIFIKDTCENTCQNFASIALKSVHRLAKKYHCSTMKVMPLPNMIPVLQNHGFQPMNDDADVYWKRVKR